MNTCSECGGIGEVQDLEVRQHGRYRMQWARCLACDGTGRVVTPTADTGTRARSAVQFGMEGHGRRGALGGTAAMSEQRTCASCGGTGTVALKA